MDAPVSRATARLIDLQLERLAWLERAGPIAKRLNAEARKDRAA